MKVQLPTTDEITMEEAFHFLGNAQFGADWNGSTRNRQAGILSHRRVVEKSILEALQKSNILYRVQDEQPLNPSQISVVRLETGHVITSDDRLVPVKIVTRSLIGHAREWGLIDENYKMGRDVKIDWPQFVFWAWEYALSRDGKFKQEELRAEMKRKADEANIPRPTGSTLDGWSTKIRDIYGKLKSRNINL